MPDIGNIGSSYAASVARGTRVTANPAALRPDGLEANAPRSAGERVEVSEVAKWLQEMDRLPAVREDKVAQAKAAIANGGYDTDEKLAVAINRMLDEVL